MSFVARISPFTYSELIQTLVSWLALMIKALKNYDFLIILKYSNIFSKVEMVEAKIIHRIYR
jgi:hypothetical protein